MGENTGFINTAENLFLNKKIYKCFEFSHKYLDFFEVFLRQSYIANAEKLKT